jgi:dATP pyrophosphohydrolase
MSQSVDRTQYKRPESVLIVVYTDNAEVLLLRRLKAPAGVWQSVTGGLRWDETPGQAARREVFEETGLDAQPVATGIVNTFEIVPAARPRYAPGVRENTEHVFRLRLAAPYPVRLDAREHSDYCWLAAGQAAGRVWSWTNRRAIAALAGGDKPD